MTMTKADSERDALTQHVLEYLKAKQPDPKEAIAGLVALCVTISQRVGHTEEQLLRDVHNGFDAARLYDALHSKRSP